MGQRLDVMDDVARAKWNSQSTVLDPERERRVLEDVVSQARQGGLDPDFARTFFAAQMEAARRIQEDDFRQWRAEKREPFADAPDLLSLRRRIDELNRKLLAILVQARPILETEGGKQELERLATRILAAFPLEVRDAALRPLRRR